MERLTHRSVYGTAIPQAKEAEITERLAACEDAEEAGLLVRLPCKVGDIVWAISGNRIVECVVDEISITIDVRGLFFSLCQMATPWKRWQGYFSEEIGKTVFLHREEAEAALAKED